MKIKLHIFQNKGHQIYLPRSAGTDQLADVAFRIASKYAGGGNKQLKYSHKHNESLDVTSSHHWGFVLNGHHYLFGEIYKRIKT